MSSLNSFDFGFDIIFALFPIIFIAILGVIIVGLLRDVSKWHRNNQQPVIPSQARIVAKRTQVSGGGTNTHSRTRYYTTFEFPNGQRLELDIEGEDYGQLAEGDEGTLSFQGTRFVAFKRQDTLPIHGRGHSAVRQVPSPERPAFSPPVFESTGKAIPGRKIDSETLKLWCSLITDHVPHGFIEKVSSAAADPQTFFEQHPEAMVEIGVEEPFAEIYLFLLVHELEEQQKLITLDWKSPLADIDWAISTLSNGAQTNLLYDRFGNEATHPLLCLAEERLSQRGQALLCLDTASDSYSLMLVAKEKAEMFIHLGQLCGLRIQPVREA